MIVHGTLGLAVLRCAADGGVSSRGKDAAGLEMGTTGAELGAGGASPALGGPPTFGGIAC